MCSQPEWTPPSETRPIRCRRPRGEATARSQAARRASFSKKLPSATASSIRARSCLTIEPGPEVEVADLGVTHLPRGQTDVAARGGELRVRVTLPERVEGWCVRQRDRVARARLREAPAVEDDECQ